MKEIIMDGEGLEQYLNDPEITMRIARVTDFLEANGIDFELYRHPPLPTIEKALEYWKNLSATHCKNLFMRNHKGNRHYLISFERHKNLDIHDITVEYQMTTVINTHDMNSVMNIGDNIVFIKEGVKEWQGTKDQVITSNNQALNDFIFASDLFRKVKEVEMQQEEG